MVKKYSEMTEEEKRKYKIRLDRYRKAHPEVARKASLRQYYKDPQKAARRAKAWRDANKDYIRQKQRETKRQRKLEAIQYLGGNCKHCGNVFHPAVYEFHHLDPTTKDRDPSKMLSLSWERIIKELDKCLLLCANCHRLEHHKDT